MKKLIIHYIVTDGGDGSAYPTFYDNELCCDVADEHGRIYDFGLAEVCKGQLEIEYDGNITVKDLQTKEDLIKEIKEGLSYSNGKYKDKLNALLEKLNPKVDLVDQTNENPT